MLSKNLDGLFHCIPASCSIHILNAIDKHRLQWILVCVAEKCGEIREVVDRLALESLLKQMSHSAVFVIIVIYV